MHVVYPIAANKTTLRICLLRHSVPTSIRGALLNAEFTADKPIYLKINKDVVPFWILQDPLEAPCVSDQGESLPL